MKEIKLQRTSSETATFLGLQPICDEHHHPFPPSSLSFPSIQEVAMKSISGKTSEDLLD